MMVGDCALDLTDIQSLHDFARKQESQLNSSALVTVWRVVIEKGVLMYSRPTSYGAIRQS